MNNQEIAEFLKQLRISKNMTQRELAKLMHVTPQAVSRWENSNSIPDINTLKSIAEFYDISVDEILKAKKNDPIEIPIKKEKPKVWKYIAIYLGLTLSLFGMSFFIVVFEHFILNLLFVLLGLVLSYLIMRKIKRKRFFKTYLINISILIVLTLIFISPNMNAYLIENEQHMQLTESKEISYHKDIGPDTHVEIFEYIFDQYALIYSENQADITIFNLSEFTTESYDIISTNQMIIKDLVVVGEHIYLSTFIQDIPGEFKLFEFDFETHDLTLLYESNRIYKLFKVYESLYLISDDFYYLESSKVLQLVDNNVVQLYDLEYYVHDLIEYNLDYQQKLLVSIHERDSEHGTLNFKVAVIDYHNFEIDQYILANSENLYEFQSTLHEYYGYNPYNGTSLYKFEGYNANLVLTHDEVESFILLSDDRYLINNELYDGNHQKIQNYMFYDEKFNKSSAPIIINNSHDNFYIIDNELMGFVIEYPDEPNTWNLVFSTRLTLYISSILMIGLFVSWGQKRKAIINKNRRN